MKIKYALNNSNSLLAVILKDKMIMEEMIFKMKKYYVTKKIATFALCAATLVTIGGVNTYAAGNYTDQTYTYNFKNKQAYTDTRVKRDTTSSYMKCKTITSVTSYTAHVVAQKSKSSNTYYDVSKGHSYKFVKGTTYKMINYVKESGYKYAAIAGNPNYGYSFKATGVWSPDSI